MKLKHSALTVGILLGVLHSLWHVEADYLTEAWS